MSLYEDSLKQPVRSDSEEKGLPQSIFLLAIGTTICDIVGVSVTLVCST